MRSPKVTRSKRPVVSPPPQAKLYRWLGTIGAIFALGFAIASLNWSGRDQMTTGPTPHLVKQKLAVALDESIRQNSFPSEIDIALGDPNQPTKAGVIYTIDWKLQAFVEKLFRAYRPDYAAFVAIDAGTGRVLSLVSYTRSASTLGNLALRANYPAASIFKIVTAAAAIDRKGLSPGTQIGYTGGNHTLYRRNVTQMDSNRWTRFVSLSEAFAKSINTVFAKVGVYMLDPGDLNEYARRFQFQEKIPFDLPVQTSSFDLPQGTDNWTLAEVASGFNRLATLSPIQAALMAGAIANDGVLMAPYSVERLFAAETGILYYAEPHPIATVVTPESADALRRMMHDTVRIGTSRSVFRHLFRRRGLAQLEVGGKTGSLTGLDPKGKYDWFVGYARRGIRRIAVAALTINEEKWQVKSSYVAKSFLEEYFRDPK